MIWAIKDGKKIEAFPKQKAICPICNEELIAKCGEIKIWHWAHQSGNDCDDWYEPESEWHINWKNEFPKEQQEIIIKKEDKYHIADVKTKTGLVIELQHSPISSKDIQKREEFYENMIWILDGKTFGKNIIKYRTGFKWKWMPTIAKLSKKPIFIDYDGILLKLSGRTLRNDKVTSFCYMQSFTKKNFLHIYGDIYNKFSDVTKLKQGAL